MSTQYHYLFVAQENSKQNSYIIRHQIQTTQLKYSIQMWHGDTSNLYEDYSSERT